MGQISTDPHEIVQSTNSMLCDVLSDSGMFISLVYCLIDRTEEELQILSAGHNPVYLFDKNELKEIESMGPVIGWDPDDDWEVEKYPFKPGTGLFMYTDGVTEAKARDGEEFGEERLKAVISNKFGSHELVEKVFADAKDFCNGDFQDDLTMIVFQNKGEGGEEERRSGDERRDGVDRRDQ